MGNLIRCFTSIAAVCLGLCLTQPAPARELVFNTQDFPPFSYLVNGNISGPGVEIIETACSRAGIPHTFRLLPWVRAQKEVSVGKAHALFLIGRNPEREDRLHFSPPILTTEYGFFVRKDNPMTYTSPSDITGYLVGVYGPSNTATKLAELNQQVGGAFTIDIRPDDESGFRKLAVDRVKAVFSNRDVGLAIVRKIKLHNLRYAGKACELDYYIGFSKEYTDKAVVDRFNNEILTMHRDGTIRTILGKTFMTPAKMD